MARHSRDPEGNPLPQYLAKSNQRFEQWILDTCLRPYDQAWVDYQQEIALRHTSLKKNQIDGVQSIPHVPLRDVIAFIPVMNETIKPYLAAKGHSSEDAEMMHLAWCKSLQLQIALWTKLYASRVVSEMVIRIGGMFPRCDAAAERIDNRAGLSSADAAANFSTF